MTEIAKQTTSTIALVTFERSRLEGFKTNLLPRTVAITSDIISFDDSGHRAHSRLAIEPKTIGKITELYMTLSCPGDRTHQAPVAALGFLTDIPNIKDAVKEGFQGTNTLALLEAAPHDGTSMKLWYENVDPLATVCQRMPAILDKAGAAAKVK